MDTTLQLFCWTCVAAVAYTYVVYPVLLFAVYSIVQARRDLDYLLRRRSRRTERLSIGELPAVSLIVAAHNEELCLPGKLINIAELDYPSNKLEVIVVSDGSTDATNSILARDQDPRIRVIVLPVRGGKANALNQGVSQAIHDVLVFSDASTLFAPDAIRTLARHFTNPKTGVACGSLQFQNSSESKQTEGVYWKYESMIRLMEGRLGATLTASGAIYAIRRECYRPMAANAILDDFITPMNARKLGYRVLYDPEAIGVEVAATSVAGEFKRRVRIAVGSFRALPQLLRTPLRGFTLVSFFSHKLMRWIVPFPILGGFVSSALLLHRPVYRVLFAGQLLLLLWAFAGYCFRRQLERVPGGLIAYFLLAMNAAFLLGFLKSVFRREISWQRTT